MKALAMRSLGVRALGARALREGIAALALLAASLASCSSPANHYYTLSAQPQAAAEPASAAAGLVSRTVAIGEIKLPGALDRPQIARRLGPNQLEFSDYDRWAGPLDSMIRQVLEADLRAALPPVMVLVDDNPSTPANVTIAVDISRFDADNAGRVTLAAGWEKLAKNGAVVGAPRAASIVEPGSGPHTAAVAATMSRALAELAGRIAAGIEGEGATAIR